MPVPQEKLLSEAGLHHGQPGAIPPAVLVYGQTCAG